MNNLDLKNMCEVSKDGFVGLKKENESIRIFLPIGSFIPENNQKLKKLILNLFYSLNLSKTPNTNFFSNRYRKSEQKFPLNSMIWLLNDYISRGLYNTQRKNINKQNIGKVNWKRTLQGNFQISNGNVIYLDLIHESNQNTNNFISQIQAKLLKVAYESVGWLFGNFIIETVPLKIKSTSIQIKYLKKELSQTYNDQDKLLILNLLNILENKDYIDTNDFQVGTREFNIIWEKMIDNILSNVDTSNFFPSSSWFIFNKNSFKSSNLNPDTIRLFDNECFIFDSKYYRFGVTNSKVDLPRTKDINKQITYGEHISLNFNFSNVYNSFVLPFTKVCQNTKNHQIIGYNISSWHQFNSKSWSKVLLILFDMNYVITNWRNTNDRFIYFLLNDIKSITTKLEYHE